MGGHGGPWWRFSDDLVTQKFIVSVGVPTFQRQSLVSLSSFRACSRLCSNDLLLGPGDASGGGGLRGGDPERLLHETRQILEPGCPGLRPLLRGMAASRDSPQEGLASQSSLPVVAEYQEVPGGPPPIDESVAAETAAVGSGDVAAAADQEYAGSDPNGGVGSVLDYGGDGSPVGGDEPGGGSPTSSTAAPGVLEEAGELSKENGSGVASEASVTTVSAGAGAREVFDRPVQSSTPTPLSAGRPQIV